MYLIALLAVRENEFSHFRAFPKRLVMLSLPWDRFVVSHLVIHT